MAHETPAEVGRTYSALAPARARLAARDAAIVSTQIALSEIAAPTGEEQRRGAWVARRFAELGLCDVRTDEAGNVIGRRPGSAAPTTATPAARGADPAPVTVCAHLDTVFPRDIDLVVRREGARLVGPGIGDNGRGLAAMLALAEEIDGLRGAKHFFSATEPPSAVVALDGAGDERVVHRAVGSRRFRITFRGPGGHSWAAYGVANAVHAASIAAARLAGLEPPREPRTTVSVARIGGGMAVNTIPEEGWLEVDLRSVSPALIERYDREVRLIARAAARWENGRRVPGTPALSCDVVVIGDRPCGEVPADHALVRSALEATRLIGREPELSTASTDANVPISRGIPAIAIGAGGRGGDMHTPAEWFENVDGPLGIARALTIVVTAAGLT